MPVVWLLVRTHEAEAAFELETLKLERQRAFVETLFRGISRVGDPPAVPDDHGTSTVVAFWDHAFEVHITKRVRFGLYGEAFLIDAQTRALWHGKALEHTTDLNA